MIKIDFVVLQFLEYNQYFFLTFCRIWGTAVLVILKLFGFYIKHENKPFYSSTLYLKRATGRSIKHHRLLNNATRRALHYSEQV